MDNLVERLKRDLENEDVRYVYADTVANAFIAAQIKGLREERGLNQEELADLVGTKQSGISRIEKADYSAWKVETLRKLAKAFGVRLRIRFEEFGTLVDEIEGFNEESLLPRKFEQDPVFNAQRQPRRGGQRRKPRLISVSLKKRIKGRAQIPKRPPAREIARGNTSDSNLELQRTRISTKQNAANTGHASSGSNMLATAEGMGR